MFKKKECRNCKEKVNEGYEFCPHCGGSFNEKCERDDFGMLGKTDSVPNLNDFGLPRGLNTIFKMLVKTLDSQFKNLDNEINNKKPDKKGFKGININISTSGGIHPIIRVNPAGNLSKFKQKNVPNQKIGNVAMNNFSKNNLEKISSLPKKEPETKIRRFSDRVIYEINLPGVKSLKDISIIQLESSIEIKAIAKNKAYVKIIPISLPIAKCDLKKEKLVIELKS